MGKGKRSGLENNSASVALGAILCWLKNNTYNLLTVLWLDIGIEQQPLTEKTLELMHRIDLGTKGKWKELMSC